MPIRKKSKSELDRPDTLSIAVGAIQKHFKRKDAVLMLDDEHTSVAGWLRTKIWVLDWMFSNFRGIPLGKGVVVWGPESVGKSSLCDYIIMRCQKVGGLGIRLDYDDSLDEEQSSSCGTDLSKVIIPDILTLEDGFDATTSVISEVYGKPGDKTVRCTRPLVAMWDSLNTAPPKALAEKETAERDHVGAVAAAYSTQLKRLRLFQRRRPILFLMTSEIRDKIGGMPGWGGPQHNLSGGKAVRHYATTILKLTGKKFDKGKKRGVDYIRGMWVYVSADKARFASGGRKGMFYISFSRTPGKGGPDPVKSNYLFLKEHKMLIPKGEKGVAIRGVDDAGTFTEKEFGEVMQKHEKEILKVLRAELCGDMLVEVGD